MSDSDKSFVVRLFAATLCVAVFAVIATMLIGLFDPVVDNDKIFAVIGPSYQMIIGCAVGLVGGLRASGPSQGAEK